MKEDVQFYSEVIQKLLSAGVLERDMRILVICGGETDRSVLAEAGFTKVVISNLDKRMRGEEFRPFEWSYQNAESLSYEDEAFDFSIVHSGLHHCYLPHKGLSEMYRVAKKGILLFEPCDNIVTRFGVRLGFGQDYEHAAVFFNDCKFGGVVNSQIPNYIYRFTDHEIRKTVSSFAPHAKHNFRFFYKMRMPWIQLQGRSNKMFFFLAVTLIPALKLLGAVLPKQSNNFAALVLKPVLPKALHPWLTLGSEGIVLSKEWLNDRYKKDEVDTGSSRNQA